MTDTNAPALVPVGRISGVYGVKGWLKVWSHTDPRAGILDYPVWQVRVNGTWEEWRFDAGRMHGEAVVVHFPGFDDRDAVRRFLQADIAVPATALPALPEDEYYWYQLEGLSVYAAGAGSERIALGKVDHLLATGANDVLVVHEEQDDGGKPRERLIPWVPGEVIRRVDLAAGEMLVDWDPDF